MIFIAEDLSRQINALLAAYPAVELIENSSECIRFQGSLYVYRIHNGYTLNKKYELQIVVPLNNSELPYVVDFNDNIKGTYHHRYTDGTLCLATDTDIRFRFLDGFDLVEWMEEYVETYYFSYEYFLRYDEMPFGERSHGYFGVLESYQDIFRLKNGAEALNIMVAVASKAYRGHLLCPCGSGHKTRKCHGKQMLKFYADDRKKRILQDDLMRCLGAIKEAREHGTN